MADLNPESTPREVLAGQGTSELRDKYNDLALDLTRLLNAIQAHLNNALNTTAGKISTLHGNYLIWYENLDLSSKLRTSLSSAITKYEEWISILKNHATSLQISSLINSVKGFWLNDVSKQAVVFGFAGLVTGSVIGLVLGYSFNRQYASSQGLPSSPTTSTMKGIYSTSSWRGIDGITLTTIPLPRQLNPDQVLVQMKAVGLDNIDARLASGYLHSLRNNLGLFSITEPFLLGREGTGLVLETGSQVKSLKPNDRVWISLPLHSKQGLMCEFALVRDKYAAISPRNISYEGGATLPYAAVRVWSQIFAKCQLGKNNCRNKRVLVHLGNINKNDGAGLLATQVLRSWGARVTVSTVEQAGNDEESNSNVAQMTFLHTLKSLGAESHILLPTDYSLLPDLAQRIFDVVVNTDSSSMSPLLQNFIKDSDGEVVETFPPELPKTRNSLIWGLFNRLRRTFMRPKPELDSVQSILEQVGKLVESGQVVPVVARSFLSTQYHQAFSHVTSPSSSATAHVGKCVLVFKSNHASPL